VKAARALARSRQGVLPVVDAGGAYAGTVSAHAVAEALADGQHDTTHVSEVADLPRHYARSTPLTSRYRSWTTQAARYRSWTPTDTRSSDGSPTKPHSTPYAPRPPQHRSHQLNGQEHSKLARVWAAASRRGDHDRGYLEPKLRGL